LDQIWATPAYLAFVRGKIGGKPFKLTQ
jgi:hypothetical protein